jgi:DNA polymerase-3 subunit delta
LKYEHIIRDIQNNIFSPIYFLSGEEPYFIDNITSLLENSILDEDLKGFNQTIIYGRDVNVKDVIDLSKRYPMMGNYQVVIVKEAQYLNQIEDIEAYINTPLNSTILIIAYKHKKVDKRKSFYKKMKASKSTVVFDSERIKDYLIPKWIETEINVKGYSISPVALMLMSEYLGNDLGKISNEINKLVINIPKQTHITENEIEENIGISKDYNLFELQHALSEKDQLKAHRIIQYFEANPKDHPLQMISPILHNYFIKIFLYHKIKNKEPNKIASELGVPPFFLKDYSKASRSFSPQKIIDIISRIRTLDLKSKGVDNINATSYGELKELVFRIMN